MALVAEHVEALGVAASQQTGRTAARAVAAINVIADEEAGKFLILLDVARCLRGAQQLKVRQLKRCNDHIAKGVYSEVVDIRPADFAELVSYALELRHSHYLDGPNDVDWIFRNSIEAGREQRLYVDYVEFEEGAAWISPRQYDDRMLLPGSGAARLVAALHEAGIDTSAALAIVDEIWHDFIPEPGTRWTEVHARNDATIARLRADRVSAALTNRNSMLIRESWTFPLHSTDVERISVDIGSLHDRRAESLADLDR